MTGSARELRQLLTFEQGGEEYALPLLRVREIVEYGGVTRLPAMPSYVLGVLDLRGQVVPVIDVAAKLGLGERPVGKRSCIVVVDIGLAQSGAVVGVLVEAVRGVIELTVREIVAIEAESEAGTDRCWHEIERPSGPIWLLDLDAALIEEDGAGLADRPPVAPGRQEPGEIAGGSTAGER